jgi:predicted membrane chloride channel (bestrophin family)
MQNIVPSLAWVGAVSTLVVLYMNAYDNHSLPEGFPSFAPNNACSAFISNTSVALSLLLVFRTNASYGRWDEARKMWGGLLNRSRDIMRQVSNCLDHHGTCTRPQHCEDTDACHKPFCHVHSAGIAARTANSASCMH